MRRRLAQARERREGKQRSDRKWPARAKGVVGRKKGASERSGEGKEGWGILEEEDARRGIGGGRKPERGGERRGGARGQA